VGDVDRFGDHHLAHHAAGLAGLDGDQGLVEHLAGELRGLLGRLDEVDPALEAILEVALAAATGVNLGLDDQLGAGEFLRGGSCLFGGGCNLALGARDLESIEELLRLVFVDVHGRRKIAANLGDRPRGSRKRPEAGEMGRPGRPGRGFRSGREGRSTRIKMQA
jgi:hypothetical protein